MASPKFQRRHYEALARAIGEGQARNLNTYFGPIWVGTIADMLADDNPRFDRTTFRDAVNASFDAEIAEKGRR